MARKYDCLNCGTRHEEGKCPMQGDLVCARCGRKIDSRKKNNGHSDRCTVAITEALQNPEDTGSRPRQRAHGRAKSPQHSGPWRKGRSYKNETNLNVIDWHCQTCHRVSTQLQGAGEPKNPCPEVRGR